MKLSFKVHKSVDVVFNYLTDMQQFVLVHPVISKIESTGHESYLVYETLKFGFVPFSFTYPATVEKNLSDKKVTIRATVFRLTKIEMNFALKADSECTMIDEEIQFRSPLPVKFIMKKVFRQQHEILFKNIDAS